MTTHPPFWRTPLAITLAASFIAHTVAYVATPHWIAAWETPKPPKFDAVIVATPEPKEVTVDPAVFAPAPKPMATRPRPVRVAKATVPVVKSEATFAAPENAIAVASSETAPRANAADGASAAPADAPNLKADDTTTPAATNSVAEPPIVLAAATPTAAPAMPTAEQQLDKLIERPTFPSRLTIAYKMTSNVADGVADFSWKRNGGQYEIDSTIQPTGLIASMFAGTFRQTSRGDVTADGIAPTFFSMQRGEAQADTAEFKRASSELKIIKHGETHLMPLPERMQDMQSFLFQMAHDAPALGTDAGARITVNVTNARKVYQYKFFRVGEETLETRMGPMTTIHLKSESSNPEDVYEVWLAPNHFYMPVKLKFYMGRFAVEQVATRISATPFKP
jgi:Protein of unknown function (DUF3108)